MFKNHIYKRKTFTLTELLFVIIIMGIFVGLGLPRYKKMIELNLNREAKNMLNLLAEAEKVYRIETGEYIYCANIDDCISRLGIRLSTGNNWRFNISGDYLRSKFTINAHRVSGDRSLTLNNLDVELCRPSGSEYCD